MIISRYHQLIATKMKTTDSKPNLTKSMFTALFVALVFANTSIAQLNSSNQISEEIKNLDKIIRNITWDKNSKYLLYHNNKNSATENEENQNIEIWMVDLSCWNSDESANINEVLCTQEYEFNYQVEDWMLKTYNSEEDSDNNIKEEDYHVESWMYNLQEYQNVD